MKKLYISFILLLGFLAFAAQGSMAADDNDSTSGIKKEKKYEVCFKEYKLKLPKEYNGSNLKLISRPPSTIIEYLGGIDFTVTHNGPIFETDNVYFVEVNIFNKYILERKSSVFNCEMEYLEIGYFKGVNVIDVPPGSYLRYALGSKEVEVLPITEELYKEIAKNHEKIKIEYKILAFLIIIGIIVFIGIFVKKLKFTKKN